MPFARTSNLAFADAIEPHLNKLEPNEKSAFLQSHQDVSAEAILSRVRDCGRDCNAGSASRECAAKVGRSLQILNQFMGCVAIATQSNPGISPLVIGGIRLILDVDLVEYSAWHY